MDDCYQQMSVCNLQISLQITRTSEINQGPVIESADYFRVVRTVTGCCSI